MLRGEVRVVAILFGLIRAGLKRVTRHPGRWGSTARGESAVERLDAVHRRGGHVRFVYSVGEPGLGHVRAELGRAQKRFASQFVVLEGADHNLTTARAEAELRDLVLDLGAGLARRDRAAGSDLRPVRDHLGAALRRVHALYRDPA